MVDRRIRAARFPAIKSLDTFDFAAIPSLNKMLVLELARSEYVIRRENVIALGKSASSPPVPRGDASPTTSCICTTAEQSRIGRTRSGPSSTAGAWARRRCATASTGPSRSSSAGTTPATCPMRSGATRDAFSYSQGNDDCSDDFRRVQSAQGAFETAVSDYTAELGHSTGEVKRHAAIRDNTRETLARSSRAARLQTQEVARARCPITAFRRVYDRRS
jgi:hypothetical protein